MLNSQQVRIIQEINTNEEKYIKMTVDSNKRSRLKELYNEFTEIFKSYYINLLADISNRINYDSALRTHKIDPAIAGGIGQSIAGVGAGIYATSNAVNNNDKIDNARAQYKNEVFKTTSNLTLTERNLLTVSEKIDKLLDSIPSIKELRESEMEKLYLEAKSLMRSRWSLKKIGKAIKKFDSLGNYKDSKNLAVSSSKKYKLTRYLLIADISLLFAIIAGIIAQDIVGGLITALLGFPIAFIVLLFTIK